MFMNIRGSFSLGALIISGYSTNSLFVYNTQHSFVGAILVDDLDEQEFDLLEIAPTDEFQIT